MLELIKVILYYKKLFGKISWLMKLISIIYGILANLQSLSIYSFYILFTDNLLLGNIEDLYVKAYILMLSFTIGYMLTEKIMTSSWINPAYGYPYNNKYLIESYKQEIARQAEYEKKVAAWEAKSVNDGTKDIYGKNKSDNK